MIDHHHDLTIMRQAELLGMGRGSVNYLPQRVWRSVKYERVYLKTYDSVSAARTDIAEYLDWYNGWRRIRAWIGSRQTRATSGACRH